MTGLRRARRLRAITLVEVIASIAILTGTLLAVLVGMTESLDTMTNSFNKRAARSLARQKLEEVTSNPDLGDSGIFEDEKLVGFSWTAFREEVPISDEIERTMTQLTVTVTFPLDSEDNGSGQPGSDTVKLTTFIRSEATNAGTPPQ